MSRDFGFSWEYLRIPLPLLLTFMGVMVLLILLGYSYDRKRRFPRRLGSLLTRIFLLFWFALYLLNPVRVEEVSEPVARRWLVVVERTPSAWIREEVDAWQTRAYRSLLEMFPPGSLEVQAYLGRGGSRMFAEVTSGTLPRGYGESRLLEDLPDLPGFTRAQGVILLHDGQEFSGFPALSSAPPLFVFLPASPPLPSPVYLKEVELDAYALVRSPLRARIFLGRSQKLLSAASVQVEVWEGQRLAGQTVARFHYGERVTEVTLDLLPTQEGVQGYRIRVRGDEEAPPWATEEHRLVRVLRDRVRILYLVGVPTWNSRMIREIFKEDPLMDLVTFQILRTIGDQPMVRNEDELSLIPFPIRELFSEELPKFDLVVFDNFDYHPYTPWDFRDLLLENLKKYVEESGGGFLVLMGDLMVAQGQFLYSFTPLGNLFPILNFGTWKAAKTPFLPDPRWGRWFQMEGANPLHVDEYWDTQTVPVSRVILKNREGAPLVVVREANKGRVGMVLSDRLWKLYYSESMFNRATVELLYRNLVRYLTGDPSFSELHAEWQKEWILPGEPIQGRILSSQPVQDLVLVGEEGVTAPVTPGAEQGSVRGLAPMRPGIYKLQSPLGKAPEPLLVQIPLQERTELEIPEERWNTWERENHARVVRGEELPQSLKKEFALRSRAILSRKIQPLTDSPGFWILGFFLVVLDLFLRRWGGDR